LYFMILTESSEKYSHPSLSASKDVRRQYFDKIK
jgi:hypothetical protein